MKWKVKFKISDVQPNKETYEAIVAVRFYVEPFNEESAWNRAYKVNFKEMPITMEDIIKVIKPRVREDLILFNNLGEITEHKNEGTMFDLDILE